MTDRLITRRAAAEILGVTDRTIRRWQERGTLSRVPVGPRTSRVLLSEIEALAARRGTLAPPGRDEGGTMRKRDHLRLVPTPDPEERVPGPDEAAARAEAIASAERCAELTKKSTEAAQRGDAIEALKLMGELMAEGARGVLAARREDEARKDGR